MRVPLDDLHGLQLIQAHVPELREPQVAQAEHDEVVALSRALGDPPVAYAERVEEVDVHDGEIVGYEFWLRGRAKEAKRALEEARIYCFGTLRPCGETLVVRSDIQDECDVEWLPDGRTGKDGGRFKTKSPRFQELQVAGPGLEPGTP